MNESIATEGPRGKLSTYIYAGAIYYISVGTLYLWGYWSSFGINILEYLNASDIIKTTAYPIASTFVLFIVGALLAEITSGPTKPPPNGEANSKFGKWLRRHAKILAIFYGVLTIVLVLIGPNQKWYLVAVLVAAPITFFAKSHRLFSARIQNESVRTIVIYVMAALPIFAYGVGRTAADNIAQGKDFTYVISGVGDLQATSPVLPESRLRLLGHAGDYMFFMKPSTRILLLVKVDSGQEIMLGHMIVRSSIPEVSSAL